MLGAGQQAAAPGSGDMDDDLALQPLEGETLGGKRPGRLSPRGLGPRRFVPPAPRPAKAASQGSKAVIPAAQRADATPASPTGEAPVPAPAAAGEPAKQTSAARLTPALRRASAAGIPAAKAGTPLPSPGEAAEAGPWYMSVLGTAKRHATAIVAVVVVLVAGLWLYKTMNAPTPAVAVAGKPAEKKSQEETSVSRKEDAPAPEPKAVEPKVEPKEEAPKVETKTEQKAAPPEKKEPEKRAADVAELLKMSTPRKARNAKADDDEPDVKAAPAPATKAAPDRPKAPDKEQGGENEPAEKQEAAPTPANEANTEKKEEADAADALGLKKKDPKQGAAGAKAAGPAPVTATEPTILPVDLNAMSGGNDKAFTEQISRLLPGWRVKDINLANSAPNANHRGRAEAIGINPLNDVLSTKLSATMELPAKFKPRLVFEMASKDGGHEFFLAMKVWGAEVLPKSSVRTKDPLAWQEVAVDLSRWAGQRIEVVFEISIKTKTPQNKLKEQVAYFRNVRLDWPGKPQATPPKPKP
ncbi:MAG: hypothetical protein NTW87_33685 [Planctomycetota bacterium]|nr:hypothetical protein [Planctomycetota bacterium]